MLNELHMLFAARDDDGIERWPRFMRNQRDTNKELIAALRDTNTKLERLVVAMERDQRMRES